MNSTEILSLAAGLLVALTAFGALWFSRRAGPARSGRLFVGTFAILALFNLLLFVAQPGAAIVPPAQLEMAYAVILSLLAAGLTQEAVLIKLWKRSEQAAGKAREAAEQAQAELERKVKEQTAQQTAELTRANEELQRVAESLKNEVAERMRMQEQAEKSHKEMMVVSRQAGMSEVATGVLHNVGNVLNSVNVSATLVADHLAELKVANIGRVAALMRQHAADLGDYLTNDPKGRKLPEYLAQMSTELSQEQTLLLKEIGFVKMRIEHINEIIATQQSYGKVLGVAEKVKMEGLVEDVLRIHATELAGKGVRVRRDYAPELPDVTVDKHKVLQVLLNLVSNAKHACLESDNPEELVTVRVTNGEGRLRVAMVDNGVGIPAANLTKIFNHGFTTKKKGGHGFGLHSGALAAKELGGTLLAQSEGPGRGATFTLDIPINRSMPARNA